jgi:TRAP-type transport system periplasmic protein
MKRVGLFVVVAAVAGLALFGLLGLPGKAACETKPIELKLAEWDPPQSTPAVMTQKMIDRINEKAGGKLKVVPYFGESLIKQQEAYRSTQLGVTDIAFFGPNSPGSPIVLGKIITLPFVGVTSNEMGTKVYNRLLKESPEMQAEYKGLKIVGVHGIPMDNFHMSKRAVHVPADAKGAKIVAVGSRADYLKAIGAVPVSIGLGDWYTSLERGLVEGLYFLYPVIAIFKGEDLFKYHTTVNVSVGISMFLVNEKKWKSLSPDLQQIIEEAGAWRAHEIMAVDRAEEERMVNLFKKKGHEVYTPTAAEMKLWHDTAKPVQDKWIAETEGKGFAAKKVFAQMQKIVAEVQK